MIELGFCCHEHERAALSAAAPASTHVAHSPYPWPGDAVATEWQLVQPEAYMAVVEYLLHGMVESYELGCSYCRFGCGRDAPSSTGTRAPTPMPFMGASTLTDGTYLWPQGYVHYVVHHNVVPPPEFITHVLSRAKEMGHDSASGAFPRFRDNSGMLFDHATGSAMPLPKGVADYLAPINAAVRESLGDWRRGR